MVIFSAPSGAGKTTLVHAVMNSGFNLEFSVSACSREKRNNETEGKDYYFIGIEGFRKKIDEGAFLEWEEVYKDHYYGTLREEVDRILRKGRNVIFDVDVYGGLNIKRHYGNKALAIFVMPPTIGVLEDRLRTRSSDSEESIRKRLDKARHEIGKADEFDVTIINDDLETAIAEAIKVVSDFLDSHA
ncbi:MAG TPA: guanylate kinase [Bacteroidales bacterium]|nr:guanylate kinase [Bacteroidales bacterium]